MAEQGHPEARAAFSTFVEFKKKPKNKTNSLIKNYMNLFYTIL